MTGPSTFVGIAIVGGLFIAAAALVLFLFKLLFWLVLLPFRLFVWLLALPLLLLKAVVLGVAGVLLGLLFVAGGALVAVVVIVPLLPIVLLLGLTWALVRLLRRPATT
jgi:hypothetical protein